MKVLSLFDGMSCGRVALERAGLPVTTYFASELDKYAIAIAQKNYPSTVQLGDVRVVREMAEAGFFGRIDLLIGGSPCQGFSFSGKQLAFDDPRSVLFFEFVHILRALQRDNPDIKFMLENVKMKKEHLDVITNFLGVAPVFINSALVSAQNRQRYYWANWKIDQPADRGIFLKDIIETGVVDQQYIIGEGQLNRLKTSTDLEKSFSKIDPDKAGCTTARQYANCKGNFISLTVLGAAIRGRYENDGSTSQRIELNNTPKANSLTTVQKDTLIAMKRGHLKNVRSTDAKANCLLAGMSKGAQANGQSLVVVNGAANRRFAGNTEIRKDGRSNALLADGHQSRFVSDGVTYRKLTPVECERLQTVPDNYTAGVSDSQRYKMLGNGWTVEVVAHIFKGLRA